MSQLMNKKLNNKINKNEYLLLILPYVIFYCVHSNVVLAESNKTSGSATDFNPSFIFGDASHINLLRFKYGNPILPGEYKLDVYINGSLLGRRDYFFKSVEADQNSTMCFTANDLMEYGVQADLIQKKQLQFTDRSPCNALDEWVKDAHYELIQENLRLDISIPQIALNKNVQGYIDPKLWDRGINAAYLSYIASAYQTINRFNGNKQSHPAFASIHTGINFASWQLRHSGQWQWREKDVPMNQSRSSYYSMHSYIQRAFPQIQSVLRLGEYNTNGEVFDSFAYRGIDLSSDDRMLPNSQLGYAPQIRGYAMTNAKVEVRQHGQLIYQTTVAAGNFQINDLFPMGGAGEIHVKIIEANGETQTMRIPYASVVQLLRPGLHRHSIMIGQYKEKNVDYDPWVVQAKYQHGLNNTMTLFGGLQFAEAYQAFNLGGAFSTALGAISIDVSHSKVDLKKNNSTGESYRLSYSKSFSPFSTYFTLAAYRYSSEKFYRLRDAVAMHDLENRGLNANVIAQQKNEIQMTMNQNLSERWGNLYVTASWLNYWNLNKDSRHYQIGYSNHYRSLNYGLSVIMRSLDNEYINQSKHDTQYLLSFSFPLSYRKSTIYLNSTVSQNNLNLGLSGIGGERFNYGVSFANTFSKQSNVNINAQYRTNYATLSSSYGYSNTYQQYALGAQGTIVAHSKGIMFGPDQGQTMVLVYAPDAAGAKVNNIVGLTINKLGYAVIPYITPYRMNEIYLDPTNTSYDFELTDNFKNITPYAGAISRVNFVSKSGKAVYIQSVRENGESLPFAAEIYNTEGAHIGVVTQGSLAFLRTNQAIDTVKVKWGQAEDQQCLIHYDISQYMKDKAQKIIMLEERCL